MLVAAAEEVTETFTEWASALIEHCVKKIRWFGWMK